MVRQGRKLGGAQTSLRHAVSLPATHVDVVSSPEVCCMSLRLPSAVSPVSLLSDAIAHTCKGHRSRLFIPWPASHRRLQHHSL